MERGKSRRELDGRTWTRYSISVWSDIEKDKEERALKHPALFPQSLVRRLIEAFTNRGDLVLDPFAGSGSTLLAACNTGRRSVGLELSEEFVATARDRLARTRPSLDGRDAHDPVLICEDVRNIGRHLPANSVHLCVTSPPYWDILNRKRTADGKDIRNYGGFARDLSLIDSYDEFVGALGAIFQTIRDLLTAGGYLVVNVMDLRKGSRFYPLHMDLSAELTGRGYLLDDIIIWDRKKEYNRLRPLGYPYVFRVNKVHEFLLIFQKKPAE